MILSDSYPYTGNGLGGLPDAIEATVTHEVNGQYEFFMRYPIAGLHYEELQNGYIIMAEPDDLTDPQPFRIYRITKPLNGVVSVYARHICYDAAGVVVEPFTADSLTTAIQTIPTKCTPSSPITLSTTRTVTTAMTLSEPRPLWKLLGGQAGSLLDVYGGEWDFDKTDAKLVTRLGSDRGVSIRYGKNLTSLEQDATIESSYSGVYPYWFDEESNTLVTLPEKYVTVTGAVVSDRLLVVDFSGDFEDAPTEQQLRDRANAYITANSVGNVKASWKVSFVDDHDFPFDQVMLGDTLHVYYEALGVNATARVVKTEYDVLAKRYKSITVGRVKQNLASIIVSQNAETQEAIKTTKSYLEGKVEESTNFIRNGAGYMRFIYNGDILQEIVSLDDPDISQASSVWRWNNGGFGHSSTGYNGAYTLAITQNGEIVADFITAGTLNANVIRAGVLQDILGKNSWNLDTGALTITEGSLHITTSSETYDVIQLNSGGWHTEIAPLGLTVINDGEDFATRIQAGGLYGMYPYADASTRKTRFVLSPRYGLSLYTANGAGVVVLSPNGTYGGQLQLFDTTGAQELAALGDQVGGGGLWLTNQSGNPVAQLRAYYTANGYGLLQLFDGSSSTVRAQLDQSGLKFNNASGTNIANYPASFSSPSATPTPYSSRCTVDSGGLYKIGPLVVLDVQITAYHTASNSPTMLTIPSGYRPTGHLVSLTCVDVSNGVSNIAGFQGGMINTSGSLFLQATTNMHNYVIQGTWIV